MLCSGDGGWRGWWGRVLSSLDELRSRVWKEGLQREPQFKCWVAGGCLPKHLGPLARQVSEVGLGAYPDSALGCHTPQSRSVAFPPSFLLLISAWEAAGQRTAAAT